MRVCLASAPTLCEFGDLAGLADDELRRVPLGCLALAGLLEREGLRPELVDLDALYVDWVRAPARAGSFVRHAVEVLAAAGADVYGLGSLCSSYPLTLRLATALRARRPDARIVLGGPQASATADETLAAFPAVDAVVRGEGEVALPRLLEALESGGPLAAVPGLSYRAGGRLSRTADAEPVLDLDALPLPAYHLQRRWAGSLGVPLEAGRGCPHACTFCSTSSFFGRRFRLKSPERLLRDMGELHRRLGATRFELVHDNLTCDRRRLLALCEALAAAGRGFSWSCSSRIDVLDDELLERMWAAGCRRVFLGVESGSAAVQGAMGKRLDPAAARDGLQRAARRGLRASVAFVAGFPRRRSGTSGRPSSSSSGPCATRSSSRS